MSLALFPFVVGLSAVGNACLRLLGIRRQENPGERAYTPAELQIIVEESEEGGALRAESGRLLHELFEFGDRTAGEAMVPRVRVAGIPAGISAERVKRLLATHRRTRYPVYDGDLDHIVGMMHVKDVLRRLLQDERIAAADARPIPAVPTTATLDVVLETMQKTQAHLAVVIDEHGGTAGILSLEDLFEEVVGEIDEGAPAAPPLSRIRMDRSRPPARCGSTSWARHSIWTSSTKRWIVSAGSCSNAWDARRWWATSWITAASGCEVTGVSGRGVKEVRAWVE